MINIFKNAKEVNRAYASIDGKTISGSAEFIEYNTGVFSFVKVSVKFKIISGKIIVGEYGCHIHEKGICEAPDFKSAGGHFDPGPSGNSDPDVNHPYHMGDLPNVAVDKSGEGQMETFTTRFTLSKGPLCIFQNGGTSIMIHAHKDSYHGGEHGSGASGGPRAACGVIREINLA
ncbi:superoxide dismutase family protein [Patescibacteria group bacterium]|nr:superoxide dismutase family protein [Patescibacteria group bacterium]